MAIDNLVEIFPWNANFETGITRIDEQHQQLVRLLNSVASHVASQADVPALNEILDQLTEYALYHFQDEENIWREYAFGDEWVQEHQRIHGSFVETILELRARQSSRPNGTMLEEILSFLTHWLASHILELDKCLAKVVLAVKSGLTLQQAKVQAAKEMQGATRILIETVLTMYDRLSSRTLHLTREIVERQKAEGKLRLAANVVENTLDAICITDAECKVIDVNPALCQLVGMEQDAIIGINLKTFNSGLDDENLSAGIWSEIANKGHWRGEIWNRRKNDELQAEWLTLSAVKDYNKVIGNYVGIFSSVSQLFEQQHHFRRMAHHDALTGLPNRLLLADRLALAIAHAERSRGFFAVCYLDLDGFKQVNDVHGHAIGDKLLFEIGQRFKRTVRGDDTVARLGGDEFALLLGGLKTPDDCKDMLERVIHEVAQPFAIAGNLVQVSVSIGVTVYPLDNVKPDVLLKHADQAMYVAKQQGKCRYSFYLLP